MEQAPPQSGRADMIEFLRQHLASLQRIPGPDMPSTDKNAIEDVVEIVRSESATTIIVPESLSLPKAVKWLRRRIEDEETKVAVHHEFAALPLEGAAALARACQELFSWQSLTPTPGFFGPSPPALITMAISPTQQVKVPWGRMVFPDIDGHLATSMGVIDGRPVFVCRGEIKRKHERTINRLLKRTEEIILENSLYRGKALKVPFPEVSDPDNINPDDFSPKFMDLTDVNPEELVLPRVVADQVETSLFTPMKHTQACRDARVPIKRGVLLFGQYGTGKTLTMKIAAKVAIDNEWTFICIDDPRKLSDAIRFARRFQPALIFAEDIDRAISGAERTSAIDEILNTIDGIDSKTCEIMVCLTTNHVEKLNRAMMRPGRLDAVIEIMRPDAVAVAQLVRNYCGELLPIDEDLTEVGDLLEGQTAAVVREICERSKMGAIGRTGKADALASADLVVSAHGMKTQLDLMDATPVYKPSEREKAAAVIASAIAGKTVEADGDYASALPNGRTTKLGTRIQA